jgi:hypothetical protein
MRVQRTADDVETTKEGLSTSWAVAELRTGHKGTKEDRSLSPLPLRMELLIGNRMFDSLMYFVQYIQVKCLMRS